MQKEDLVKLSPPWYTYHRKVMAMFDRDPEVHVRDLGDLGGGRYSYIILVDKTTKANALKKLLGDTYEMGNITISIAVLGPEEDKLELSGVIDLDTITDAFTGNPIFEGVVTRTYPPFMKFGYCIFKKEVIQFWNDDLSDYCGNYNGLAADIASEIFKPCEGVTYCTSAE